MSLEKPHLHERQVTSQSTLDLGKYLWLRIEFPALQNPKEIWSAEEDQNQSQ